MADAHVCQNIDFYVCVFASCRGQFDQLRSVSLARLSSLKELLLSLGQFEEAYDELKDWLANSHHQLQNPELVTGDVKQVTALLTKHKVCFIVLLLSVIAYVFNSKLTSVVVFCSRIQLLINTTLCVCLSKLLILCNH